jgi:plasmid replication initiation protein
LEFSDKDSGEWVNGCFITTIAFYKNKIRIRMNPDYLSLFGELDKNYLTMWSSDIFNMRSERAVKLYEVLRENTDTRKDVQQGELGIKAFKEMFNIPK